MVRLGDVSSFVPKVNPTSFAMCVEEKEANCCGAGRRASSSTGSTNSSQTCLSVPARVYTIGSVAAPMHRCIGHAHGVASGRSLWDEDATSMEWLDAQPEPRSVLYVSFGSPAVLLPDQLTWELGLEQTNRSIGSCVTICNRFLLISVFVYRMWLCIGYV
jgi:hypothetical protein